MWSDFNQPIQDRNKNLSIASSYHSLSESSKVFSFFMAGFCFENGGRRAIRPILEKYQAGKVNSIILIYSYQVTFSSSSFYANGLSYGPNKGESEGYTVKSKERDFPILNYPLEQTEFYYAQKQGMAVL